MSSHNLNPHRRGWFGEYSQRARDELLICGERHEELVGLFSWCPQAPSNIDELTFPGYVLIQRLDNGTGPGMVFLAITDPATHAEHQRQAVCIKLANITKPPEERTRAIGAIENELRVLRQLEPVQNGHLPQLVEAGAVQPDVSAQVPYMVTRYLPFLIPLSRCYKRHELTTWIKIAELVQHFHRQGIVHGDLYERNIFLTEDQQPVVLDFGSARRLTFLGLRSEPPPVYLPPGCAHIDESTLPHQQLTCAFDVACLAETFRRVAGDWLARSLGSKTSLELDELIRTCTRAEPEYRPQNAGQLAEAFHAILHQKPFSFRPRRLARFHAFRRRYPAMAWVAAVVTTILLAVSVSVLLLWHQEYQSHLRDLQFSAQLQQSIDAKNDAMRTSFRAMRAMLKSTVALDEADVPAQADGAVSRQALASELARIVELSHTEGESRLAALRLLLDNARANLEVEGSESARACLDQAARALANSQAPIDRSHSLDEQLLRVQLLAMQAATQTLSLAAEAGKTSAAPRAKSAVTQFLSIKLPANVSVSQRQAFLSTGLDVLIYAVYPQRGQPWLDQGEGGVCQQVFVHTLSGQKDLADVPPIAGLLAKLHRQYALMIHKSFVPEFLPKNHSQLASPVHKHIALARSYLVQCPIGQTDDMSSLTEEQSAELEAGIKTVAGLSLVQSNEYASARAELQAAFEWRQQQMKARPGSLRILRALISTGWTLSDTYYAEASGLTDPDASAPLFAASIPIRQIVVDACERQYRAAPDRDYRESFLVNSVRLAHAQIMAGQIQDAVDGLRARETILPLDNPGLQHTCGEDLLFCSVHLHLAYPDELQYSAALQKYAELLIGHLNSSMQGKGPLVPQHVPTVRSRLSRLFNRSDLEHLITTPSWVALARFCDAP